MTNLLFWLLFLSVVLFSCKQTADKKKMEEPVTIAVGTINTDSIAPPVETLVTGVNAPIVIPAPEPKVVPLKYPFGVGQPSIVNYTIADGLPQNLILTLAKDKQGNIWCGGLGFVSKYDGSRFTNYFAKNGLDSEEGTSSLVADSQNNIWIGKYDGLYWFDGQSFHSTPLSNYDKNINLRKLLVDSQGAIWAGTGKGVFRVKGDSMTHYGENEGLPKQPFIQTLILDQDDRVLVSSRGKIYRLEENRFVLYSKIPVTEGKMQVVVGKDFHNNLWTTRSNSPEEYLNFIRYNDDDSTIYSLKEGFKVNSFISQLIEDKNGIIWIATNANGLIRFDGKKFINYTTSDGLPADRISGLLEDDYGNIWVSTPEGISRLSYQFMNRLENQTTGKSHNNSFAIGPDGTRWIFDGFTNSLIKYRKDDALVYDLRGLNERENVGQLFIDRTGQLWLPYLGKIIRFDNKNFYVYGKEQGVLISRLSVTSEDKQGNILFSGREGVLKFDGNMMKHYGTAQGFPAVYDAFLIDKNGYYWLGSWGDSSLYKYDGKQVIRYSEKDGFVNPYVSSIAEDPFGNIWLGTSQGVVRFDGKQFISYSRVDGLNSQGANIAVDTVHRLLWFASLAGLSALRFDEIQSPYPLVLQYDQRKGYDIIPTHLANDKIFIDSSGIWGNGYTGIYRFDYDKVRLFKEPLLQIRNIRVDNRQVVWSNLFSRRQKANDSLTILNESVIKFGYPLDNEQQKEQQAEFGNLMFDSLKKGSLVPENLRLPYKNNSISFEFAAISPSFAKYTQYRYKLDGHQDIWSPLSTKDEAFFGNMREGKYTFRIQAINASGVMTELSYSFMVLPPWWRTWWAYTLYLLLFTSGIYLFIRWRTKALQKEKIRLEEKVTTRTAELKESLENLKATQSQLIQSEKMASLGELTAGIAHEIQNPLNFVNNFSEVNRELLAELKDEMDKGNIFDAKEIANDVISNEEKINYHGNRADAIVKSMLQHSRSSSGIKELTDINALADEYLRLSYHGLRAKDQSFNATIKTDFDQSIGNINVISQDIGRVLLNLINNAFYAVNEKKKQIGNGYEPEVTVSTRLASDPKNPPIRQSDNALIISVRDNGNGIPENIRNKIFQPFFTTKPTGQGTGLGLSLSYDIVKAHGGELKVNTRENEGTEFIIQLPIS